MRKALVGMLVLTVVVSTFMVLINHEAPGVVALPGYAHAVALCQGDVPDVEVQPMGDEGFMWQHAGIMYVVNTGHMDDPEVKQLEKVAAQHCAQYQEKDNE